MNTRRFFLKVSVLVTALITALAMAPPPVTTQAAAPTIVVATSFTPSDCGKYTDADSTDPVSAVTSAQTGSTVIICPGTYTLSGPVTAFSKKLTIKRALTGPGSRPVLTVNSSASYGIVIDSSTVTLDGLILDASSNTEMYFTGVYALRSSLTIKNSTILGADTSGSIGIAAEAIDEPKAYKLSITNSTIAGYQGAGISMEGAVKLNLSSSHLDGSDEDRVDSSSARGVDFNGLTPAPLGPTGVVTKSRILNNAFGVLIFEASKVSITNNTLVDNDISIYVGTTGSARGANNNKITGNTILGIPSSGRGVNISNTAAAGYTISKFTISKNVFVADRYGSSAEGVHIHSNVVATPNITGSITSNAFVGIAAYYSAPFGPFPGVKEKSNDAQP